MNAFEYLTGVFLVGVTLAACWLSGRRLRGILLPSWLGPPAALATIVLALSVAIVLLELLGALGLLETGPLLATSVAVALGLRLWRPEPLPSAPPRVRPDGGLWLAVAIAATALTAVHWAGPVLHSLDVGIYRQDSTWYHLPFAAWFAQGGSIGGLLFTDPLELAVWYYPLNSELLHGAGMVLLGNDLLSPLLNFGWMGLALLAAWCIGRPFGVAAAALLGTVLIVDSDMMLVQAGNAPSDVVALACLLAAAAMLANGLPDGDKRSNGATEPIGNGPLAVAALACGLAIGTKVTMLVPVAVISIGIVFVGPGGRARRALIWGGGLIATGGFWYLRNAIHAGNPLPWFHLGPLGGPAQEGIYPRPAHAIVEYIASSGAWTHYFFPGLEETLGPLWFVVVFASLAGIVLGLRRRHGPLIRILALAGAATLIAHVFNPVSASGPDGGPYGFASNLRYAAPGLAIGLVLLPLCESGWLVRRAIAPAYALLVLVSALASAEWVQPQPAIAIALGVAAVLTGIWLSRGTLDLIRRLAIAVTVMAVLLGGYFQQRRYFRDRYAVDVAPALDNPGFRASNQWKLIQTWAREQHGMRIGIAGTPAAYGQYVFYGADLSNRVRYLGEPVARGGLRSIGSCRRWRERIDAGNFDAVVVTPEDPSLPIPPPQLAWTALGGTAQPVLSVAPAGVFVLRGRLDPTLCGKHAPGERLGLSGLHGDSH